MEKTFNFRALGEHAAKYCADSNTFVCGKCFTMNSADMQNEPVRSTGTLRLVALLQLVNISVIFVLAALEHFNVMQPVGLP